MIDGRLPSIVTIALIILATAFSADAQQTTKTPRIGYLTNLSASASAVRREAFRQGLRERGYVEGKNIVIEWRSAEEKLDRLPALAAELVRLKVDIIVTTGGPSTRSAKEATATIPIVMTQDRDPVGSGFVASLARPGGNITGLSRLGRELSGKRLELLKETVPTLSRLAVFGTSTTPGNAQELTEIELAAGALGIKLQHLDVLGPKDFEMAFREASKGRADAGLMMVEGSFANLQRPQIAALAVKSRLPVIYATRDPVQAGGLMSYGGESPRLGQARGDLRGQNPERREASRPPGRTAD